MSAVLRLVEHPNLETIAVLEELLAMARKGEIKGMAVCYTTRTGEEKPRYTGLYRNRPSVALHSVMRLSWDLTQIQDRAGRHP